MAGWPGSVHDVRVLANSQLFYNVTGKKILITSSANILGTQIVPFLIGDSAYLLNTWLIKPFPHHSNMTDRQKTFNYKISRACIVMENAFGHLKGRWRRLAKQDDMYIENVPQVVLACCILHNLSEVHSDNFYNTWLQSASVQQRPPRVSFATSQNTAAAAVRDTFVQ